jgi:Asp-tRNA(Asn)/Glu-tRNA(Gln) amidotransferase A subunit family amidase
MDRKPFKGPLHGIPVGVKDIMDTADMPTCYGSPIYQDHRPARDASCVARIRAAGGIVLGKTETTEFALFHPAKTANPHNLDHTPGGSSSGSAAAVADFMVPLATGTQTAGSIIRPAAFCGVFGFKPSYGLIERTGVKPVSDTLDTIGIFTRDLEDLALLGEILTGRPFSSLDNNQDDPLTIGFCPTHEWPLASPETVWALEEASRRLKAHGIRVKEVKLSDPFSRLGKAHETVMVFEAAGSLALEYERHKKHLSSKLREVLELGNATSGKEYEEALACGMECRALLQEIFSQVDFLLAPSVMGEAPKGLSSTGDPVFNRIWTFLYTPCLHLPMFKGPQGLPLGVQLVGRSGDEARLLGTSHRIMGCLTDP